jgi:DNA (cytosine-5)-methyltransferase 1
VTAAYYNEREPHAAHWLRNLIARGLIAPGDVDERSIADVGPDDLAGYRQCHFFAGIGVWSRALRSAGWPDDREAWTGSCPCQTHSSAARGRHVEPDWWPEWRRLVAARRPRAVFGEQVAAARRWLGGVRDDLEGLGYAFGAANLPALCVGADHIRPRIYFAGHTDRDGEPGLPVDAEAPRMPGSRGQPGGVLPPDGPADRLACLRAFGNAIHADLAEEFVKATMQALDSRAQLKPHRRGNDGTR